MTHSLYIWSFLAHNLIPLWFIFILKVPMWHYWDQIMVFKCAPCVYLSRYSVCIELLIILIFALPVCIFCISLHTHSQFLSLLGNSDSWKWDSWFEGETSARGRSAGLWRGSEWNKGMHTGEDGWTEFLMFIGGRVEESSFLKLLFLSASVGCSVGCKAWCPSPAPPIKSRQSGDWLQCWQPLCLVSLPRPQPLFRPMGATHLYLWTWWVNRNVFVDADEDVVIEDGIPQISLMPSQFQRWVWTYFLFRKPMIYICIFVSAFWNITSHGKGGILLGNEWS